MRPKPVRTGAGLVVRPAAPAATDVGATGGRVPRPSTGIDDPPLRALLAATKDMATDRVSRYMSGMAKQRSTATTPRGTSVIVGAAGRSRNATTTLGNVTVRGKKPSAELVRLNIVRSTQALERVGKKLITRGVRLSAKKGVPRYSADENDPKLIVRSLNGQPKTGRLLDGRFVEIK